MLNIRENLVLWTVVVLYSFLIGSMPHAFAAALIERAEQNQEVVTVEEIDPLDEFRGAKTLDGEELKQLLRAVGFEGKSLRVAWTVAMKESNGRPKAHNDNLNTGDNSYGIFQINMLGGLGDDRREKFDLDKNKDLFDPVLNAQIAHHMTRGGEDWSSWKIIPGSSNGERYDSLYEQFPKG